MSSFEFGGAPIIPSSSQASDVTTVGDAGAPPFEGAWADSGDSGNDPTGFVIINNVVYLLGVVTSGVIGTNVFTLPPGYRPGNNRQFPCISNGALGIVTVYASGSVEVTAGNILGVSLSGISFVSV